MLAMLAAAVIATTAPSRPGNPNILLIVCDDLGIENAQSYGWMESSLHLPVLSELANKSVRFTRAWSMADGAPSRAAMLTGRFPLRTRVVGPATPGLVTPTQLHPAELTLPDLLEAEGFQTALFGRYDLGQNGPSGPASPVTACGFDRYAGTIGSVPSIDTTIAGQAPAGTFTCGVPTEGIGACCLNTDTCVGNMHPVDCLSAGGVPRVQENTEGEWSLMTSCDHSCKEVLFDIENGHFRWIETEIQIDDTEAEQQIRSGYNTSRVIEEAESWVHHQSHNPPWFCMVSFDATAMPVQPAPPHLVTSADVPAGCDAGSGQDGIAAAFQQQYEAMDAELGRMLEEMDLGSWYGNTFELEPFNTSRTWIILTSDGGTAASLTQAPFDADRAAGTLYQTGLSVPLLVAGPDVVSPGRDCDAMVNVADIFVLISEISEIDLVSLPSHPIDGRSMMPLLIDVDAEASRTYNFADMGVTNFPIGKGGLCVFGDSCEDYRFANEISCVEQGGQYFARGAPHFDCCEYWQSIGSPDGFAPQATRAWTIRNEDYKLILRFGTTCPRETACEVEFYHMPMPMPPSDPGVESPATRISLPPTEPADIAALDVLRKELRDLIESEPWCVADLNHDRRVNSLDLIGVLGDWGKSQHTSDLTTSRGSFYDATQDGFVGTDDILAVIHGWSDDCTGETPFPMTQAEQDALGSMWNFPWYNLEPMDCLMKGP